MSKLQLAMKLADETGASVQKVMKYVDEVGQSKARTVLDDAAEQGSKALGSWKPVAAVGAIGGGGVAWKYGDVKLSEEQAEQAQAQAEASENYADAVKNIMDSDLPPEAKQALIEDAGQAAGGGGGSSEEGDDSPIPDDPAVLIVLIIVLALVMRYSLGGDE